MQGYFKNELYSREIFFIIHPGSKGGLQTFVLKHLKCQNINRLNSTWSFTSLTHVIWPLTKAHDLNNRPTVKVQHTIYDVTNRSACYNAINQIKCD